MALTKIGTDGVKDDAVTEAKLANAINTAVAANTAKDLTALSAANLTSGTIPDARFPATLPAASAANLTSVPAGNLTGTVADARISTLTASKLTGALPAISAASCTNIPAANITGTLPAISGANLTNLPAGGKATNLVINGAMELAQRGTSSTVYGYGSVDRWRNTQSGITVTPTHSQETATSSDTGIWEAGFRKYLRWSLPSAGTNSAASWLSSTQFIEAQDVASSGWNYTSTSDYITVSFWIRASTNQTFYANLGTRDGTRKRFSFAITASGNNTWTKITKTIPGHADLQFDLNSDRGLDVQITVHYGTDYTGTATLDAWVDNSGTNSYPDYATTWLTAGASTFDITGVQLEIGNSASDFAHETFADTLIKCQRYYYTDYKTSGMGDFVTGSDTQTIGTVFGVSTNEIGYTPRFPVLMRGTPTVKQANGNYFIVVKTGLGYSLYIQSNWSSINIGQKAARLFVTTNTGALANNPANGGAYAMEANSNNLYLAFDAEL